MFMIGHIAIVINDRTITHLEHKYVLLSVLLSVLAGRCSLQMMPTAAPINAIRTAWPETLQLPAFVYI